MSRILLVWQLGGNLGHITQLLVLAKALRRRGHHVSFALEQTQVAAELLAREAFPFVKAPVLRSTAPDLPREPASYPETLFHFGFADSTLLTPVVRAWRELYRKLAPDLIVFDHAPTALLAARGTGIPRVVFGTGFTAPPRVSPMPSLRPWQQIPLGRLQASEQRALDTANAALRAIGVAPLIAFHELFDVEENILATLPELDHYGPRRNVRYWGPIFDRTDGSEPQWPAGEGMKLFVYLRLKSSHLPPFAAALRKLGARTLWFAPSLTSDAAAELTTPSINVVRDAVDIPAVCRTADAAVLHGGHSTTAAMLLGGVPVILLPQHVEQLLLGRNVAALGAGAPLNVGSVASGLETALAHLIHDKRYGTHAKAFAVKYKALDQKRQQNEMLARLETLVIGTADRASSLQWQARCQGASRMTGLFCFSRQSDRR